MPLLLAMAVGLQLNAAASTRWPLLEPAQEQFLVEHRHDLTSEARRAWALDRALPMLAGEIEVSDTVLKEVLGEVARAVATDQPDLRLIEQARRDYEARELQSAARRYAAIEKQSPLWPDALRERAWTLLLMGRPGDALGATVSLRAPYFPPEEQADGRLMKATVFLDKCRYDEARAEIATLADTPPEQFTESDARAAFERGAAPDGRSARLAWASPLVVRARSAWGLASDPGTRSRVEATGVRLLQASFAAEAETVRGARERALKIRYESFRQQRGLLESSRPLAQPKAAPLPPIDDDEVEWTFDGTFWRDELGTYRYAAADACPREAKP